MKWNEYVFLVKSDLYRYFGKVSVHLFLYQLLINPGFKYSFWMRTCFYFVNHFATKYSLFILSRMVLLHYEYKYGISISYRTPVGSGFYIGHVGGIVVNVGSAIGKNCNISHDVTLGQANRGDKQGCPTIGDNVYIGPGAKIIGNVYVGNGVAVGANCVVTKDVPDHKVVAGIPGKIISDRGSDSYINYIDYSSLRSS